MLKKNKKVFKSFIYKNSKSNDLTDKFIKLLVRLFNYFFIRAKYKNLNLENSLKN